MSSLLCSGAALPRRPLPRVARDSGPPGKCAAPETTGACRQPLIMPARRQPTGTHLPTETSSLCSGTPPRGLVLPAHQPGPLPRPRLPGVDVMASGHEQVVFCSDPESGLRAVIAVYSTALGPALGGTRFFPYASEEAAVTDALALSKAMAYKNSLAGLDLGGGKAVIIGDPRTDKTEALLRAYGRFVEALGGRYLTACDVGTYNADLDVVARETRFAHGRSEAYGGCGDSSVLTAYGVFQGMRAAAQHCWGTPALDGRTVAVAGVGKVGSHLVDHLVDDGATVVVTDVDPAAVELMQTRYPQVKAVPDTATLIGTPHDVYSPNALGGALDEETVAVLPGQIVCGGANNQLATPEMADRLRERGILYAPDYLVNAGGVIQVEDERHGLPGVLPLMPGARGGFNFERAKLRAGGIFDTALGVFKVAHEEGISPALAADHMAEERIRSVGRLATIRI